MGPSGSGKSFVGARLAAALALPFIDADDLHPAANVEKMAAGVPLTDEDRMPWLDVVAGALARADDGLVVACSALARRYRRRILDGCPRVVFAELAVDEDELERRMRARSHFMPASLLESQMRTWEPLAREEPGVSVANVDDVDRIVGRLVAALDAWRPRPDQSSR